MPGIDTRAPERTDTSSGLAASPNVAPTGRFDVPEPCSTCAFNSAG